MTSKRSGGSGASSLDRRDFLKGAAGAAGTVVAASAGETVRAASASRPDTPGGPDSRMGIGINLEYVRHADKSLAYGIQRAGQIGYRWVEPCFLDGRCLLSNAGYCHVTSMDTDPKIIKDRGVLSVECGTDEEAVRSHAHLRKVLDELQV